MPDGSSHNLTIDSQKPTTSIDQLATITSWLTNHLPTQDHRASVADALKVAIPGLDIDALCTEPVNENGYSRNVLYTDPNGRFSILGLKWYPGAETPIHGHNAWGCVGVLSGTVQCETYDYCCDSKSVHSTGLVTGTPGVVATVNPNPEGIHRIFNDSDTPATTLHIYGLDLAQEDQSVNVWY
ncbi:hypothetical protein GCM10017044_27020 [Kordiimonas sediminis]|uniref:Cysteine dioxygenase n=1 Tax=Kordiimonas sediminis TaxID=1735581 RepID=A0A919AXT0_9PROT|nr:cysteine dioxygenase family protein [Kordiimonas sediminis]GHF30230.1 hypothetical protein GCM10017044_27020 [Kordiimonas sediminis]